MYYNCNLSFDGCNLTVTLCHHIMTITTSLSCNFKWKNGNSMNGNGNLYKFLHKLELITCKVQSEGKRIICVEIGTLISYKVL